MSSTQPANVFWFLPTHGDGHYLGTAEGGRAVDLGYLKQVAQAADTLGYYGVPSRTRATEYSCPMPNATR